MDIENALLGTEQVESLTGLTSDSLRRLETQGRFPRRVRVGERRIAWLRTDVERWLRGLASREVRSGTK